MDSGSKDTADRHEAEDRRPDGLADSGWEGGAVSAYTAKEERGKHLLRWVKMGGERKGDVFAGVRRHEEKFTEEKKSA